MKKALFLLFLVCAVALHGCNRSRAKGPRCGGLSNLGCSAAQFCELIPGCGGIDHDGFCNARPESCPGELSPVCGCDGLTYSNGCYAAMKGVSVRSDGACVENGSIAAAPSPQSSAEPLKAEGAETESRN